MKTDELISLLATDPVPEPNTMTRRFTVALALGMAGAYLLMVATHGIRADLAPATLEAMFWGKLIFAGSLAFAGLSATQRLGHPGVRLGGVRLAIAVPVGVLWLVAAVVLVAAAPEQRSHLILGETWSTCAFSIAMISLPLFMATLWAMRGLAPTHLALAGASAGLLAGSLSTLVYALHCPESGAPFIAVWYVMGIAIPTLTGTILGPRVLRW
jgi:hypothetical protein